MHFDFDFFKRVISALPDPVFVVTESGRYAFVSGGREVISYNDCARLAGMSVRDVLPAEKAEWFIAQIQQTLSEDRVRTVEYTLADGDVAGLDAPRGLLGEMRYEGRLQPLPGLCMDERAVVWVARNVTSRHKLEGELRHKSETDALTGAYNRRKLLDQLAEQFRAFKRYGTPSSLLIFDLDYFKAINDRYGHGAGDDVLCAVSDLCLSGLREVDLFCRIGGEEFAVLLPNTRLAAAERAAERMRHAVRGAVINHGGEDMVVSISVGVGEMTAADESVDDIIKRVDDALYAAKRAGRDCVKVAGGEEDQ